MIQDIIGVLPPLEFTLGRRFSFLQDIKNAGSYKEKKIGFGSAAETARAALIADHSWTIADGGGI